MAGSEIHPVLSAPATFVAAENILSNTPLGKNKVRIDFAVDSVVKNGAKRNRIPAALASQLGAVLSVKVDAARYEIIKHLLKPDIELNIVICPLPWKVENGSGMFFDLIEVEKFELGI
jgi:hypothetical protein